MPGLLPGELPVLNDQGRCESCLADIARMRREVEGAQRNERSVAVLHQRKVEENQRLAKRVEALEIELEGVKDELAVSREANDALRRDREALMLRQAEGVGE